ncbi:MAG: hypothetical protein COB23_02405 [Methylophaga sp.]|nr:MAG: hypothetical protein COB23_02405 [Methylophaga sp.]
MKNLKLVAATTLLLGASVAVHAETDLFGGKVKAGGYLAQQWQTAIEVDGPAGALVNAGDADADSGFNRLRFGMWFNIDIADRVSAFVEIAEEPNDFGNSFAVSQDLAWVDIDLTDEVIFRFGNVVETTMNFIHYSDGAAVQGNPLIGNAINDRITAAEGAWLLGNYETDAGKLSWNATVTKPSFFSDFSDDSGYNYGLRTSFTSNSGFGIGAGLFIMDGDASCIGGACTLAKGGVIRSLITVGDGDNYEFAKTATNARHTAPGILPGIKGHIWQVDAMWSGDSLGVPVTLQGFYGQGEDDFSYTAPAGQTSGSFRANLGLSDSKSKESFWGVLARVDLTPSFYLATRYGVLNNDTSGVTGGDQSDRLQVGGGYWMNDSTLIKFEYVEQDEEAGSGGGACNQSADCEWDGFVVEASVSF